MLNLKKLLTKILNQQVAIVANINLGSIEVNSSGAFTATVNVSSSIPSGFKLGAVIPQNSGSYAVDFYQATVASDTSVTVSLMRRTGSVASITPRVSLICVRAG